MSPSGCLSPSEGCIPEEMGGCPLGTQEREGGVEDGGNYLGTGRGRVSSTGREVVRVGTGQKGDMNGGRSAAAALVFTTGALGCQGVSTGVGWVAEAPGSSGPLGRQGRFQADVDRQT